ncbi:MAG: hypothetical protein ACI8UO_002124 [Verrucomicrobiales bacterium]|jgi:hypothetical protein
MKNSFKKLLCRSLRLCALCVLIAAPATAQELPKPGEKGVVRFAESPPQSAIADQIKFRLSASEDPGEYDVTKEEFEVLVPANYDEDTPHGLFIWIGAGGPGIPKEWEAVLAEKDIILIAARNSGNKRDIFDRVRMAIDANINMRSLYNIDGRRVYVSGHSGGSRVASMLGVCWGDMFSGALCFMGVNFYTDLAAEDGKTYGLSYLPNEEILALSKKFCRYALVTAEKDFNLPNTRAAFTAGFQKEGFEAVEIFEVPEHGHGIPPAKWLCDALDFLDKDKR